MNAATITIPRSVAIEKLANYKRSLTLRRSQEDADVARALREVLRGSTLINLPDTIERGGMDQNGRPRIAVARADWEEVFCSQSQDLLLFHRAARPAWNQYRRGHQVTATRVRVRCSLANSNARRVSSRVPEIPPHLKPADLRGYHVLWEANWLPAIDPDPALIKWVAGEVWVLVATWELSPLEQAVLAR